MNFLSTIKIQNNIKKKFKSHNIDKTIFLCLLYDKQIIYKFINTAREYVILTTIYLYKHDVSDLDCTIVAETLTDYDKTCD